MPRFLVTYRWELWLLLWAPLLGGVASVLVFFLYASLYDEDRVVPRYVSYAQGVAASLVHAGLLAVFYARIRRLERPFFTLVWSYAVWLAVVGTLVWLMVAALAPDDEGSGLFSTSQWVRARSLVHGFAALLPLFWFARRASLISLAHAYFLFLVLKTYLLTAPLARTLNLQLFDLVPVGVLSAIGFVSVFGGGTLFAWLLGNFGSRGAVFRKRAVAGLLALYIVSGLWELVELATVVSDWSEGLFTVAALTSIGWFLVRFLVFAIVPLALIYLVRVRDPASTESPTDLRVQ